MNKKERVIAALEGRPVDRVPVSFWRHMRSDAGDGPALGRECAEKHLAFYRSTDLDFIKIMQDGFNAPFDTHITSIQDLRRIRPADPDSSFVRDYIERAMWVNELIGGEVPTYCNLFSPFMLLRKIGDETLSELIRQDEKEVAAALDRISEGMCGIIESLLTTCGCFGLFVCFQGAEFDRFSPDVHQRLVRPGDLRVMTCANRFSAYNIAHFCAWDGGRNDLTRWRDYPARAVNWAVHIDRLDLAEGKAFFGGRPVMGGFDNRVDRLLFKGTKEQVQAETHRLVAEYTMKTGSANGLILGADCSFLPPFELERFNWVTDALATAGTRNGLAKGN